jgi:opacity protein-like surface antigen
MKHLLIVLLGALPLNIVCEGKFDGISLGASIGADIASLKEKSITEGVKQPGANGKIYVGLNKSFLDIIFIGAEAFGRYSFFVKAEASKKENAEAAPQFGGYLRAGIRPSENFLIYGLYGIQSSSTKIKGGFDKLFERQGGSWSTIIGAGIEYAFGLGTAVRLEGTYEPETSFKITDVPDMTYDANFFSLNLGVTLYL